MFKKLKRYYKSKKAKIEEKIEKLKKKALKWLKSKISCLKSAIKALFAAILLIATALAVPEYHRHWLENKVGSAVVQIQGLGLGSGFQVLAPSGKKYIVTNSHVCNLAILDNQLIVFPANGKPALTLSYIYKDEDKDLCILPGIDDVPALKIGTEPEVSQRVWTAGHPLGGPLSYSTGIVRGYRPIETVIQTPADQCTGPRQRTQYILFFFKVCLQQFDSVNTTAETYPGNSGGPLVDYFGEVVGVVFASSSVTHWGEAVPLKHLNKILETY